MNNNTNRYPKLMLDFISIAGIVFLTWILVRTIATKNINWDFLNVLKFIGYFLLLYVYPTFLLVFNHLRLGATRSLFNGVSILYLSLVVIRAIYLVAQGPVDDLEVFFFLLVFSIMPILALVFNNK